MLIPFETANVHRATQEALRVSFTCRYPPVPQDECSSAGVGASAGPRVGDPPQTPLHLLQQDVQAHHIHAATAAQGLSGLRET
ncbi:unnamed protein product, partial [Brenthis ino]